MNVTSSVQDQKWLPGYLIPVTADTDMDEVKGDLKIDEIDDVSSFMLWSVNCMHAQ